MKGTRARPRFGITREQERLLDRRLREAVKQQPEIRILRELLLGIGGFQLVAPPGLDSDVPLLIDAGFIMVGPVQCEAMGDSKCHQNIAKLWTQKHQGIIGIGTGYALSDDGLWRQHSWGLGREGILETTRERTTYFGVLLQGGDADSFAESNPVEMQRAVSHAVNTSPEERRISRSTGHRPESS
jgi:hypothetical protein